MAPAERSRRTPRRPKNLATRDENEHDSTNTGHGSEEEFLSSASTVSPGVELEDSDQTEVESCASFASGQRPAAASRAAPDCSWFDFDKKLLRNIGFPGDESIRPQSSYLGDPQNLRPAQVYRDFFDKDLVRMIVAETNRNAKNYIDANTIGRSSRAQRWEDTSSDEIEKFFGIVLYMGLVPYPSIPDYWSTNDLYGNRIVATTMSRNRFQLLLRFVHFSNNQKENASGRSSKFIRVLEALQDKFCLAYTPGDMLVVDETMVPFRGRLSFRQYIPGKSHKYGIKIFKLCNKDGYTFRTKVYTGAEGVRSRALPSDIVIELSEPFLDDGWTLVTDNYFTSVPLAKELLGRHTNLLGTLRRHRKFLPQNVVTARLDRNQLTGRISRDGIVVGKWKDKRDVLFLSTKHDLRMASSGRRVAKKDGVQKVKPLAVIEYNKAKQGVDISDQLASFYSPLRKTIRWYHKVVFELLLNTAVVNSRIIFNKLTGRAMSMKTFRAAIVEDFLQIDSDSSTPKPSSQESRENHGQNSNRIHSLITSERKDMRGRKIRGKCQDCYSRLSTSRGRISAQNTVKKVNTRCQECQRWLCVPCFTKSHQERR
ncbi:piggyBac transposable element-derived protein 4-like [Galendromus occidentalis]|uniref:PiggyBac transposable element-derived protein 4-like n=1 Tax=Galendromus occidentalis TaxID=34638 RepID=A0AAJ6VWQ6_9ACAR|nr:piggyBac transposable element-derived protein 4-like [Galendromus occidentalis]